MARFLLTETEARDLEIAARGIEEAFLTLTGDHASTDDTEGTTDDHQSSTIDPTTRRVPPMGGFNLTVLRIELKRMLRNRRTIIFTLLFPAAMFFAFGSGSDWNESVGDGNVAAYVMTSMALYGAALTAAAGGAMVALERALGWSRQLRLTPLNPAVYILMKALLALVLGAVAIADRQRRRDRPGQAVDAAARLDRVRRAHPRLHHGVRRARCLRGLPGSRVRTRCRSSGRASRSCPSSATCSSRSTRAR